MKKKLVSIIALIVITLISNSVYAASTGSIALTASKSKVKAQEEFTVVLKATDTNNLNTVEYSKIKVTDVNGNPSNAITLKSVNAIENWAQMSYDGKTAFVYSASATQTQDVCKITFAVADNAPAGTYNISIEDLIVYSTNLEDDTTTVGNKIVNIEVQGEENNNTGDDTDKDQGNTGDNTDKNEGNTGDNTDKDQGNTGDNTDKNEGNTGDNTNKNEGNTGNNPNKEEEKPGDNTGSNGNKLPQTGVESITVIAILVLIVVSRIFYVAYKKYKDIQ